MREETRMYWNDALNAGSLLVPFRYAKFASVRVGVERNDILARETVCERELRVEFIAELAKCPEVPRFIREYIESGMKNRNGGVAIPHVRHGE